MGTRRMKQHIPEITVFTLAVIAVSTFLGAIVATADLPDLPPLPSYGQVDKIEDGPPPVRIRWFQPSKYEEVVYSDWLTIESKFRKDYRPHDIKITASHEPIVKKKGDRWIITFKEE
jgi:hypothetical protein